MQAVKVKVPLNSASEIIPAMQMTLTLGTDQNVIRAFIHCDGNPGKNVSFIEPLDCVEVSFKKNGFRFYMEEVSSEIYITVRQLID